VNKQFREAPVFYWLITLLIVIGAGVILIPNFPLIKMILVSQVINGMLLPLVLIFMTLLVNKSGLMKEWTNSTIYNFVSWTAVAIMIGLTVALVGISVRDLAR
jgi:Mn2+/Fe2+ NRAMP family transporter